MDSRRYPPVPRIGVGAVVMKDGAVLLVCRRKPPGEALWAIPGGLLKLGETLKEGAEREIKEETGITIRAGRPLYVYEFLERDPRGQLLYHYVIIDLQSEYLTGTLRAADDALACRWVRPEECRHLPLTAGTEALLQELHFLPP